MVVKNFLDKDNYYWRRNTRESLALIAPARKMSNYALIELCFWAVAKLGQTAATLRRAQLFQVKIRKILSTYIT